ncbi:MAG: hypothetical protein JSW11_12300 [Candidatus Heimdallarchaeota archaeon]|nr:MAG: hypothetical protein JSW11_12300 [Candidatus Heimdallarchaeota archaeon]
MRFYKKLVNEEKNLVETTINHILDFNISNIIAGKELIKIIGHRFDIYLIQQEDLSLFNLFSTQFLQTNFNIVHARIKLGFFIHEKFLIGIESLTFLAPYARRRIQLDARNTNNFIYGKDVDIDTLSLKQQIKHLDDGPTVMIFSNTDIPIGYAKIRSNGTNKWLQNLIDIGIYIRSEKSAF